MPQSDASIGYHMLCSATWIGMLCLGSALVVVVIQSIEIGWSILRRSHDKDIRKGLLLIALSLVVVAFVGIPSLYFCRLTGLIDSGPFSLNTLLVPLFMMFWPVLFFLGVSSLFLGIRLVILVIELPLFLVDGWRMVCGRLRRRPQPPVD